MRGLLRLAVTPLLLATAVLATWVTLGQGWNRELALTGLLVFTLAYLTLFEQLIPLEASWYLHGEDVRADLVHLVSVSAFSGLGFVAAFSVTAWLHQTFSLELAWWPGVPLVWQAVLAMAIGEFLPYWYHRLSHMANQERRFGAFLWRVHAIHHITPRLNSLKASWMHPVNTFVNSFVKLVPVLALGFDEDVFLVVAALGLVIGYLSHANVDARSGPLDYLIATPHIHHFHHSVQPEEAQNYGLNLTIWDQLFGTYFNAPRRVAEVGVHSDAEMSYPTLEDLSQQLRFPFMRSRRRPRAS